MSDRQKDRRPSDTVEESASKDEAPPMAAEPEPSTQESAQPEQKAEATTSAKPSEPSEPHESFAPPLPDEEPPAPLPDEAPPQDDGWEPVWDATAQAYYFYNRYTHVTQWENPRVPDTAAHPPAPGTSPPARKIAGGYNPAIHGDYDPTADYAIEAQQDSEEERERERQQAAWQAAQTNPYGATGAFNRFTGKWQAAEVTPDRYSDEAKSRRQMNAFFDVDAAANSHDGRSLRVERQNRKWSKAELKAFREKKREKKEEKRRAWLRD